jgi:hypothetical protein
MDAGQQLKLPRGKEIAGALLTTKADWANLVAAVFQQRNLIVDA